MVRRGYLEHRWESDGSGRGREPFVAVDWDTALEAVKFEAMPLDYLNGYVRRTPEILREENGSVEQKLVPDEAKQYFDVKRLIIKGQMPMSGDLGFYCVAGISGAGKLTGAFGEAPIKQGKFYFIPACLPGYQIASEGDEPLEVITFYPPAI